jgi:putative membrane protein
MVMRVRLSAALTATVAFLSVAQAQTPSPQAPSSMAPSSPTNAAANTGAGISRADQSFVAKAAAAGAAEIADAQIALTNSRRQDVKDFAQRMIDDHTKAANQLKLIAGGKGIALPSGETSADQKQTDALKKLTGTKFDHAYITGQRTAHKQAVALFTTESKNGKDSQLQSFAAQTLPTLQDHLKMITAMPLNQKMSSIIP